MAYTQADLDALDADIAKVRLVKATTFENQSTTFRDLDELLKLRAVMAAAVNGNRTRFVSTSKGV
jgi:hypothetical protein